MELAIGVLTLLFTFESFFFSSIVLFGGNSDPDWSCSRRF